MKEGKILEIALDTTLSLAYHVFIFGCRSKHDLFLNGKKEREIEAMARLTDLTGRRFERLVVTSFVGYDKDGEPRWQCKCNCGTIIDVDGGSLISGHIKACGCTRKARQLLQAEKSTKKER